MSFEKASSSERALEILGLNPKGAYTADDIKRAYRQLALKYHPDRNKGKEAESTPLFESASYAYEYLTDPSFRHKEASQPVPDVIIRHTIPFESGFFGTSFVCTFSFATPEQLEDKSGFKFVVEPTEVVIPAGTIKADLAFPGKGIQKDDYRGVVIIHVEQALHPKFKMQGMDIHSTVNVPLETLLCGGVVDVETMYGLREMKIPPGTPPGSKIGIPLVGVNRQGHQYVDVQLVFPPVDELKTKDRWKGMNITWEEA